MDAAQIREHPFTPADAGAQRGTVFRCALCGLRFTHGRRVCSACPLRAGCDVVSCPRCGHGFPRSSWIVRALRRMRRRRR